MSTRMPHGHDREATFQPLNGYASDVYSQNGEDGILGELLRRLGVFDRAGEKWCVEFGAWDGVHLSNTCNLIRNHGFRAVLVEGERKRYRQLCRNLPGEEVIKICRWVSLEGEDRLDAILGSTPIPKDFDLLSIDIDGADYHVWQSLRAYRPKLVIIEINPTIPVDVPHVQPADFAVNHGSGVKAMDMLAREKRYTTVCVQGGNMIAVRNDLLERITPVPPPPIEDLAADIARLMVFVGYDGTVLTNFDELPMLWHPTTIESADLQVLPRFLRHYTGRYTPLHWLAFGALDYWRRLKRALRRSA